MLKNTIILAKNYKTNIDIIYINKMLMHNNSKQDNIIKKLFTNDYRDLHYSSCKICSGTGFTKNFLYDIHKIENNLENNKYLTPHKICISCHGTGKRDYDAVFYYTCCQK
jgi:hypothetical protein